jgi:hypothetical protein
VNDLSILPPRLRETAEWVSSEWFRDGARSIADLLRQEGVSAEDGALIAESIYPGAGKEHLK